MSPHDITDGNKLVDWLQYVTAYESFPGHLTPNYISNNSV